MRAKEPPLFMAESMSDVKTAIIKSQGTNMDGFIIEVIFTRMEHAGN